MGKKTVVFFSAVGGYDVAARAIKEQFEQRYSDYQVIVVQMHEYGGRLVTKVCNTFPASICRLAPWAYSAYNHFLQRLYKKRLLRLSEKYKQHGDSQRLNEESKLYPIKRMKNIYDRFKPLAMVSFEATPQALAVAARKKYKLEAKVLAVLSDYTLDMPYVRFGGDGYCVDNADIKEQFLHLGIDADRVNITGLPAFSKYAVKNDSKKMREAFELPDRTTVILSGGSFGAESTKHIFKQLLQDYKDINIVAVAGRNDKLKLKLQRVKEQSGADNGYILGYTTEFDRLLDAADVLICQGGAMSVNEAFIKGIPVIVACPESTMEMQNAKYLQIHNLALFAKNFSEVSQKLRQLLNDPELYNQLVVNITKHAKKDAAKDISEFIHSFCDLQAQENLAKVKDKSEKTKDKPIKNKHKP